MTQVQEVTLNSLAPPHLELAAQSGFLLGGVGAGSAQGPDVGLGAVASLLQLLRLVVQLLYIDCQYID